MKSRFLIAAGLMMVAGPAFASTPYSDPFTAPPNDQALQSLPGHDRSSSEATPFAGDLKQNRTDAMRPMNERRRGDLVPPHRDASGVPAPRI